jgi:hypothetical protein
LLFGATAPQWAMASSFARFLDHTLDTPQSVGILWTSDRLVAETFTWQHTILWTSDRLVAETFTWQHTTLTTDIDSPSGIRTHNLSRRVALDRQCKEYIPLQIMVFMGRWQILVDICRCSSYRCIDLCQIHVKKNHKRTLSWMPQSCSATGVGVSASHKIPRACITMTRKLANVVTEEIAVVLLVLFTVVI